MMHMFRWLVAVLVLSSSCAPTACNEESERALEREVEVLIGEPGPAVAEAKTRLLARGTSAIALLETGLYQADENGRRRIVETLKELGDPEVLPILRHLARRDVDPEVRQSASAALAALSSPPGD